MTDETSTWEFGESNPEDFDVERVNTALGSCQDHYTPDAYQDERERVLALEATGKARKGILDGPHAFDGGTPAPDDLVTVYMVGTSHAARSGDPARVSPATAERLVRQRHAITQDEAEKRLAREIRET